MKHQATKVRLQVLAIVVVVVGGMAVILWRLPRGSGFRNDYLDFRKPNIASPVLETSPIPAAGSPGATQTVTSTPDAMPSPAASEVAAPPSSETTQSTKDGALANSFVGSLKLIIPVVGVKPDQLMDTFTEARSEGRVHDAIDIPAPAGTPVMAVAGGEVIKLSQSERGGTTIYQLSTDKKLVFYYAHLQRYADGLTAGQFVHQGEVIAYVGDTGNAGAGNYHLHFSIAVVANPKRYWEGTNINPYPLLHK